MPVVYKTLYEMLGRKERSDIQLLRNFSLPRKALTEMYNQVNRL